MTEAQLETAAAGKPWSEFRALFPDISPVLLRRIHWRVKARIKRGRKTKTFVPSPELLNDLSIMINPMIRDKYGISYQRICDLRKEIGVPSPVHLFPRVYTTVNRTRRVVTFDKAIDRHNYHNWVNRDNSIAGQSADYLRKYGPVVRCDDKGRYKANGTHWRRGSSVLTADEIIERAEANGFDARAWARIAA